MYTFYLFLVCFLSLLTFYPAAMVGIGYVGEAFWGWDYTWGLERAADSLSLALAAGVVWFVHWRMLAGQRKLGAGAHQLAYFHLFIAMSMLGFGLVVHGSNTLDALANLALGFWSGQGWALAAAAGANLAITFALWLYHLGAIRQEAERGAALAKRKR
jgi:hypothetical protein